jgi:hypothetical protein
LTTGDQGPKAQGDHRCVVDQEPFAVDPAVGRSRSSASPCNRISARLLSLRHFLRVGGLRRSAAKLQCHPRATPDCRGCKPDRSSGDRSGSCCTIGARGEQAPRHAARVQISRPSVSSRQQQYHLDEYDLPEPPSARRAAHGQPAHGRRSRCAAPTTDRCSSEMPPKFRQCGRRTTALSLIS